MKIEGGGDERKTNKDSNQTENKQKSWEKEQKIKLRLLVSSSVFIWKTLKKRA